MSKICSKSERSLSLSFILVNSSQIAVDFLCGCRAALVSPSGESKCYNAYTVMRLQLTVPDATYMA